MTRTRESSRELPENLSRRGLLICGVMAGVLSSVSTPSATLGHAMKADRHGSCGNRGRSLGLWSASGEGGDRVIYPIVWKFVSSRAAGVCDLLTNHGMTRRSVSSRPFTKAKTTSSTLLSSVMGTTPNGEQCNLSSGHKRDFDFDFVCAFNKSFHCHTATHITRISSLGRRKVTE